MRKLMYKILATSLILALVAFSLTGCKKDDDPSDQGTADFSVNLFSKTLSRSTYESVKVDIQKVSIHTSGDSTETNGWFDLETNGGIYDLMDFMASDTLLAFDSLLQVQTVSQIRLILGSNNTVTENGTEYPLQTPSGQTSGLKLQVHAELQADKSYIVTLNFDPDQSVLKTGNNNYKLRPKIETTVIEQ